MKKYILLILSLACALLSCSEEPLNQYSNLEGPNYVTSLHGDVCITTQVNRGLIVGKTRRCDQGERGNIGLVTNGGSDSLVIIDLYSADFKKNPGNGTYSPRFFDSRPGIPGVTHVGVGRFPIAVKGNPNGRIAYTLNQIGRSITRVDLLHLKSIEPEIPLPATPRAFDITANGDIVTIYADSPLLTVHPGSSCTGDDFSSCTPKSAVKPTSTLALPGYPTDIALTQSVANKDLINANLNNNNQLAFVSYRDRNDVSLIALDAAALTATSTTCLDGSNNAPCLVKNIPLTYGCSDGIDNDGDGKIDRDDPQCVNPWDSEGGKSATSGDPSRGVPGECNDGTDNDGDGLIDGADPDCAKSGGMSESSTAQPIVTACNDGIDNDGDGKIDASGGAPGCYLPYSLGELLPPVIGFDKISIDPTGSLLWVLDRANNQVLLVDVLHGRLIDVPRASEPSTVEYNALLGIPIPGRPISLQARIFPQKQSVTDSSAPSRSSVYFSAYVGSDNGFLYNVDAFQLSCPKADYKECLGMPAFSLADNVPENTKNCGASYTPTCSCAPSGRTPTGEVIPSSASFDESLYVASCGCNAPQIADSSNFLKEHTFCPNSNTKALVSPIFSIGDSGNGFANVPIDGQCSLPDSTVNSIVAFSQQYSVEANSPTSCNSVVIPQPRSVNAADTIDPVTGKHVDPTKVSFTNTERVTLTQQFQPAYRVDNTTGADQFTIVSSPLTRAIVDERWKVTYQGILPSTKLSSWTLPLKTEQISVSGTPTTVAKIYTNLNVCTANIRKGDLFEITSLAKPNCSQFDGPQHFLRYEIVDVTPQSITVKQISGKASLPTQGECFSGEVLGNVRAAQEWVVDRRSGFYYASQVARGGQCVPSMISEDHDNRLKSGEIFVSPGLSFKLYNGFISPDEDLEYTFDAQSNYRPTRYRPEESPNSPIAGNFPYQISYASYPSDDLNLLLVADPTANLLWVNVTLPTKVSSESNKILPSTYRFVLR